MKRSMEFGGTTKSKGGIIGLSKLLFDKKKQEEEKLQKKYRVLSTHDHHNGTYLTKLR